MFFIRKVLILSVSLCATITASHTPRTLADTSLAIQKLNWLADEYVENQLANGQIGPDWDPNPRGFVHGFIAIEMYKAYEATGNPAHKTAADMYFTYYMNRIVEAETTPANHGIMMYSWSKYKDHNPQSTEFDQRISDTYGYMQNFRWSEPSYFRNGYSSTDGMDAANTCDLASMGVGLLNYYEKTGNAAALADAEGLAQYFVSECVPYTYQGAWSSPLGTWVVAPTGNTHFEHHLGGPTVAYQLGWGFGAQEAADYLMPLYNVTTDETLKQKIKEKCVASMKWQLDACQFEDGALGLFEQDDKWMGMTIASVQTFLWNYDVGFLTQNEIEAYAPKVWAAEDWMLNNLNADCLSRAGFYQVNGDEAEMDRRSNGYWSISWAMEPLIRCDELAAICGVSPPTVPGLGLVETEAVNPSPTALNMHGVSVALDGDYLAVGSNYQYDDVTPGTVEIYLRNPNGSLTHQQTLTGFSGSEDFGIDVSLCDDTLAVGAMNANSTYVYTRSDSTWFLQQTLTGSGRFGTSVSISGDTMVVGAYKDHTVSIFHRDAGVWSLESTFTKDRQLGYGVGVSGDVAISGAWDDGSAPGTTYIFRRAGGLVSILGDANSDGIVNNLDAGILAANWQMQSGATWAMGDFNDDHAVNDIDATLLASNWQNNSTPRNGAGGWTEEATLQPSDATTNTWFGYRSDVYADDVFGDVAIVSAKYDDELGADTGAAYIFRYDSQTESWSEQVKLLADDVAAADNFGSDVAIFGNTAIVGSRGDDDNGSNSGSAYIFQWDGITYDEGKEVWLQVDKITASDGAAGEMFGEAVDVLADSFAVGAWGHPTGGGTDLIGSVYVYAPAPTQAAVPEPGTLTLMLAGLCMWLASSQIIGPCVLI